MNGSSHQSQVVTLQGTQTFTKVERSEFAGTFTAQTCLARIQQLKKKSDELRLAPAMPLARSNVVVTPQEVELSRVSVTPWGPRYLVHKRERGPARVPRLLSEGDMQASPTASGVPVDLSTWYHERTWLRHTP